MEPPDAEPSLSRAEPFFRMNFAQAVTVAVVILGALWTVFGVGRDTSDNTKAIAQLSVELKTDHDATQRQIDSLKIYVENIDRQGTQFGKGQLVNRTNEAEATVKRVERLEDNMNKLIPTVTQMSTNLEWISGWVKAQAQQPPDRRPAK